jgi:hypothetical protein
MPTGVKRNKHSVGFKFFTALFIPPMLIYRVTADVFEDTVSLFSNTSPPPAVLGAIFKILRHSTNLSLAVCLDGNLDKCNLVIGRSSMGLFKFENQTAKKDWETLYLQCLELALSSEGDYLRSDGTRRQLLEFYNSVTGIN